MVILSHKGASFFVRKLLFHFDLKAFLLPQCKRNGSPWQGSKTCSMASIFGMGSSNSHLVDCTSTRVTPHPMCMWIGRDQVKKERRKVSVSKVVWNHSLKIMDRTLHQNARCRLVFVFNKSRKIEVVKSHNLSPPLCRCPPVAFLQRV